MKMDAHTLEEAEAWFARLLADERGNREGFERWLHALPAHAAAWDQTQALWQRMGTLVQDETLSDYVRDALEPEPNAETGHDHLAVDDRVVSMFPRRQRPARRRSRSAYAAAAAIVVCCSWPRRSCSACRLPRHGSTRPAIAAARSV